MAHIRYGLSYWLAQVPKRRRPAYPRHRGATAADVAVVGGGLTGCACAYAFAAAGIDVALIEAGAIGQSATAASTGFVMQEPELDYRATEAALGRRAARRVWQATRRAALDLGATIRRLRIRCQLEPSDAIYLTTDPDGVRRLRREYDARRAAGLDASWLKVDRLLRETNLTGRAAILTHGNGRLDPYRLCLGLAAAASRRGAEIFERSPVAKIKFDARGVDIRTVGGLVRANRVIVATGGPGALFRPLARHVRVTHTYAVATPPLPAAVRAELGRRAAMLWDTEAPYHYLCWTRDDRILFGGADQTPPPSARRERTLVQRAGQLMYELSRLYPAISGIQPDYAWDGPIVSARDGLPYIGAHRNYPRHLFAFAYGGNGLATGFLASRLLLRHHVGQPAKGDEVFGFTRGARD